MPRLEQLLELLKAEPGDSFLRYGVAMEYAKAGEFEKALTEFNELLRRAPEYVAGYFMAGRTCEQKGDVEEAKRFYREGIVVARRVGDEHAAGEISQALMMLE
ncbi:MAG: tetratricopeptide repeat protein [Phycisphaerae bacterium]